MSRSNRSFNHGMWGLILKIRRTVSSDFHLVIPRISCSYRKLFINGCEIFIALVLLSAYWYFFKDRDKYLALWTWFFILTWMCLSTPASWVISFSLCISYMSASLIHSLAVWLETTFIEFLGYVRGSRSSLMLHNPCKFPWINRDLNPRFLSLRPTLSTALHWFSQLFGVHIEDYRERSQIHSLTISIKISQEAWLGKTSTWDLEVLWLELVIHY